jgi:hypothetical protein
MFLNRSDLFIYGTVKTKYREREREILGGDNRHEAKVATWHGQQEKAKQSNREEENSFFC